MIDRYIYLPKLLFHLFALKNIGHVKALQNVFVYCILDSENNLHCLSLLTKRTSTAYNRPSHSVTVLPTSKHFHAAAPYIEGNHFKPVTQSLHYKLGLKVNDVSGDW